MATRGNQITVLKRHRDIIQLRSQGLLLKEIQLKLGLRSHNSILYHLEDRCNCNKRIKGLRDRFGRFV